MPRYGRVEYDLATSGMTPFPLADLATAPTPASLDDPTGLDALRDAIARHVDVPREETIATLGAAHALWLAYASLTSPGDEIAIESPTYEPLVTAAEGVGARLVRFERAHDAGFALDPARVAAVMTHRTRIVAVTNLHNPTGVRASDEAL